MFKKLSLLFFAVMSISIQALAYTAEGETIPHGLNLLDQKQQSQSFDNLKSEKGLVLAFIRSAAWCPYCKGQLRGLETIREQVNAKGYSLAAISYDKPSVLHKFSDMNKIGYPLLSDKNSEAIKAFGLLNTDMTKGSTFYGIPHPAIYVISAEGKVVKVLKEKGFKNRPTHANILNHLN